MKKLAFVLLLLFSAPVLADGCLSGSFYNPEDSGWGVNVDVLEDQTVVFVYTDTNDWILLQGVDNDMTAYQNWNGDVQDVGTGGFVFIDEDHATLNWSLWLDINLISRQRPIPWCLHSNCWKEVDLVRLTQPVPCD